jgi:hypothetical protein
MWFLTNRQLIAREDPVDAKYELISDRRGLCIIWTGNFTNNEQNGSRVTQENG